MAKGTRKIDVSFEETHITHFGGMWLIQRFCNHLGLKRLFQRHVRTGFRLGPHQDSELFLALIYAIIMGLRRINKTEILQYNGAFLEMLGLKRFPDQATLRRFLKRLSPKTIRQLGRLHDSLRAHLFALPSSPTSLTFDLDSVVVTVYGKQQGAQVGYNPKKHGRRSYHPIFCFEAHRQEFWHGAFRPGNTVAATGARHFIRACLGKVPSTIARSRIRFRLDAGFYGRPVIEFIDGTGCGYVMAAKQFGPLKRKARACHFQALANGNEVAEFRDQVHFKWPKLHRFVVVRRPIPEDPVEAGQLKLFKDKKYVYHVFVTNLNLDPWRIYLFYNPHAIIEKNNREMLYDYPLGKIPTDSWTANVAFFQLMLLAFDLVHWFKRLCLKPERLTDTLDAIRTDLIVVPARLVNEHGKKIIKLPHDHHHQEEFLEAWAKIQKLRLPRNFRFCK
jgi:Transposase DDE domain group 1